MDADTARAHDQASDRPVYQIRVQGILTERWSDWFDRMTITSESGVTIITGPVADQAALYGMLSRIRDLNLKLISVTQI